MAEMADDRGFDLSCRSVFRSPRIMGVVLELLNLDRASLRNGRSSRCFGGRYTPMIGVDLVPDLRIQLRTFGPCRCAASMCQ
jgi:hypothetical protein